MKGYFKLVFVLCMTICYGQSKTIGSVVPVQLPGLTRLTTDSGNQYGPKFSNTGRYLAYISTENKAKDIYLYDFQEKRKIKVTHTTKDHEDLAWSPDDRFLSFTSHESGTPTVQLFRLSDGVTKDITHTDQRASDAQWSPDGNTLVMDFNQDGKNIWLYDITSSKFTQLTHMQGDESNFGFSYQGNHVGFNSRGSHFPHLQAIHLKTGEIIPLVGNEAGFEWMPQWSNRQFEVIFYSTWNNEMTDIWITDGSEEGLMRITDQKIEEFAPVTNHNENLVAYFSWDKFNEIKVYDRKRKSTRNLQLHQEVIIEWNPMSWSPVDNRLAFVGRHEKDRLYAYSFANDSIALLMPHGPNNYEMDAQMDDSGEHLLFLDQNNIVIRNMRSGQQVIVPPKEDHQLDIDPHWVPGSNGQIAFVHLLGGASDTNNVWLMERDGSNKKQLTDIGGIKNFRWIDRDNLAFTYDPDTRYDHYDIWTYNRSSHTYRPLLQDKNATLYVSSVSPNGKQLLFTADFEGTEKIYKLDLDRPSAYMLVENTLKGGSSPIFSNSGKKIAFVSDDNEEHYKDIYIMDENGGEVHRITHSPEEE